MIDLEPTRNFSDVTCPYCEKGFDAYADEDSNYNGAITEVGCPECGERFKITTNIMFSEEKLMA